MKNRVTAGLLAILLGGLGIHKFYLNKPGIGLIYLLFCWTGIPAIIGLVEGVIMLTQSDEDFKNIQNLSEVVITNGGYSVKTLSNADELLKYKELYDAGAINQEEYEKKKQELL